MATSISLDDLVALNDEIASLSRAGIPLELGLSSWQRDLSGPLGKAVSQLSDSISQGRRLDEALADPKLKVPPVYRAVVTAGLLSGRLPAALEAITQSAVRVQQLRKTVALALIYPLVLVTVAYDLLLVLLTIVLPAFAAVYEKNPPASLTKLVAVGEVFERGLSAPVPMPVVLSLAVLPPLLLWGAALIWWLSSRRSLVIGATRMWRCIPLAGRAIRRAQGASLAEIFALLLDHSIPLPEAVRLAGECTSDRKLAAASSELASRLEQGELPTAAQMERVGLPPALALIMTRGARPATLVSLARAAANAQRRRVERDIVWLQDWFPVWIILTLGTAIGVVYCLTFFVPFSQLIQALGELTAGALRGRS